jgi:hypothetical protein
LLGNKVNIEDVIDFTFQSPFRFDLKNELKSSLASSLQILKEERVKSPKKKPIVNFQED